jgi:hypothetical protein
VDYTFASLKGFVANAKATLFTRNADEGALELLNEPVTPVHSYNPLVQIENNNKLEETRA